MTAPRALMAFPNDLITVALGEGWEEGSRQLRLRHVLRGAMFCSDKAIDLFFASL